MKLSFLSASLILFLAGPVPAAVPPNVLVIVSDDQGYADAGFTGGHEAPTPHLDALAKSGVRCTSGYVSHPFCSPSRAGLLTGRYQQRFGHEFNPVYDPLDPSEGLPLTEKLLPEYLQEGGYITGWVGKWHLGASPEHTPWRRGFAECFGFIGGGHRFRDWKPDGRQYTLPLTRDGDSTEEAPPHLTPRFGEEAAAFVRRHPDKPWMLYLAFNAPHTPHEPTLERETQFAHIEKPGRRRYLAQVSLLDDAVGGVMAALTESGQREKTLVFFFSDNGGPVQSSAVNTPLRGGKGTVYESGVRVPFLISSPGTIPSGGTFDAPVSSLDVFATALGVAGVTLPPDKTFDSTNLVPHLTGDLKSPPHEHLFWRTGGDKDRAVREGDWKLVRLKNQPAELYHLATDPGETRDLAAETPEVTARLTTALDTWDKSLIAPVFLGSSVKNEDWGPGGANQKIRKPDPKGRKTPEKAPAPSQKP